MDCNFSKNAPEGATQIVDAEVVNDAPPVETETPSQLPAVASNSGGAGELAGDFVPGFKDIVLPRINIVQGVGLLKDSFPQGAIVFGQSLALFAPAVIDKGTGNVKSSANPPVEIVVLGFRPTRYVEKTSGNVRGIIVSTEAEVRAAGGTLDYNEWKLKEKSGMKRFEVLAEAFVIVKRPDHVADDDSVFTWPVGKDKYALGLWAMKGSAYTHAAKRVFFTHRRTGCLVKEGYPSWSYNVTTRSEVANGNTYYVPVCVPKAKTTPEVREFVHTLLNPPAAAAAE